MKRFFNLRVLVILAIMLVAGFVFADGSATETVEKTVGVWGKISLWGGTIFALLGGGVVTAVLSFLAKKFNVAKYAKVASRWIHVAQNAVEMFEDNKITKEELASVKIAYNAALGKATNEKLNHEELDAAVDKLQSAIGGVRRSA